MKAHLTSSLNAKTFVLLSILILGLSLIFTQSFARGSELNISLWNKGSFEIEVNHQHYYSDRNFMLDDLRQGKHRVKIFQRFENPYGHGGGSVKLLYDGFVDVPANSKVIAEVRPNRRMKILDIIRLRKGPRHDMSDGCVPRKPKHRPIGSCGGTNYSTIVDDDCMDHLDLGHLIRSMNEAWFDDDRMTLARQAIRNHSISSDQVRQIMMQFDFESNRLEFAKFAFHHVSDPHRYYLVNDAFDFSSSIRQLDAYIYS